MQPLTARSGLLVRLRGRTKAWKVEAVHSWTLPATGQSNANKMLTVHGKGLGDCSLCTRQVWADRQTGFPWHNSGESTTLGSAWTLEIAMTTCQHRHQCLLQQQQCSHPADEPLTRCGDVMLREKRDMTPYGSRKKGSAVRLCTYFGNVTPVHC